MFIFCHSANINTNGNTNDTSTRYSSKFTLNILSLLYYSLATEKKTFFFSHLQILARLKAALLHTIKDVV